MRSRLADRLLAARRRRFVGREPERELFRAAVTSPELPFCVLHVYGPGGVGKTTLLKEMLAISEEAGVPALYLDARNIEPSPESFTLALQMTMGLGSDGNPVDILEQRAKRHVILIDTYELMVPLDSWLREVFLPQIPDDTLIVFGDRKPPSAGWGGDPGWQDLIHVLPLRNLNPDESRNYLEKRQIPPEQHQRVLDFTHGHPLALSLVADVFAQRGDVRFLPEATPDVVKALLEQLVQKVPGPAHRIALEVCALVRMTTESLLANTLGMPDAHELFDWLRGLSFIESGPLGLFPHDLAREALVTDLRWRNRDWYTELHRRLQRYYMLSLEKTTGLEQQRVLFDYLFLHRDNPIIKPFIEWQEMGTSLPEQLKEADIPDLLAMVERHEGVESAEIARHWLRRVPENVLVFHDLDHKPAGFILHILMNTVTQEDHALDPAMLAAVRYLRTSMPLRPGEISMHFRYWMGREDYQSVSPMQSLAFINIVRYYFTPGLAFHFLPVADPDFWAPAFDYADLHRVPEADFEVGSHRYGIYGHNWRLVPPLAWLGILAEREIAVVPQGQSGQSAAIPVVVLSQDDFVSAVQEALKAFQRPDGLRRNPLLQSRLVLERAGQGAGAAEQIAALQNLIRSAADVLKDSPRDVRFYRAVQHTYFQPAPTQEQAAELLDLPFSTYRRHLKDGVARLAEILWQWELQGAVN